MPDASRTGQPQKTYDLSRLDEFPELTPDLLRAAYYEACLARFHVERVVQECSKGRVKFAIWGPGEEIHGTAAALALNGVVDPNAFGVAGHYRSASLLAMWSRLRGYEDFHLDHMRQQLSKVTDPWSGGRQMTAHFNDLRFNTIPVQSALGMQVSKSVGYAEGFRRKGITNGVVKCIVGDGTCAEGDVHEGMTGASILQLPWLLTITDNDIAISVKPEDGRGIKSFEAYAKAFDFAYFECDGNDFLDVYATTRAASTFCRDEQKPALLWVKNLSRLNDHSSAADFSFKWNEYDPLIDFGQALVRRGILEAGDVVVRRESSSKDYFAGHELGRVGGEADAYIVKTMEITESEPDPTPESAFEFIRDPFPEAVEPEKTGRNTVISINGAVRAAMAAILEGNPMTWIYGQDVGAKGGVMQATRGLYDEFPGQVRDAPINEPFIIGAAIGFALHEGATALPEIQFSDYSLNTLHWLVYLGNLLWTSNGTARANVILRLPVEPLHGGAVYHSMCMEGFYASIPGSDDRRADDVARHVRPFAIGGGLQRPGPGVRVQGPVPHDPRRRVPQRAHRSRRGSQAQAGDRVRGTPPEHPGRLPRAPGQGERPAVGHRSDPGHLGALRSVRPRSGQDAGGRGRVGGPHRSAHDRAAGSRHRARLGGAHRSAAGRPRGSRVREPRARDPGGGHRGVRRAPRRDAGRRSGARAGHSPERGPRGRDRDEPRAGARGGARGHGAEGRDGPRRDWFIVDRDAAERADPLDAQSSLRGVIAGSWARSSTSCPSPA